GLNPEVFYMAVAKHFSVRNAVESNAARETNIRQTGFSNDRASQAQHDLLGDSLNRRREIHLTLSQAVLRLARRAAEQRVEFPVRHREPGAILEVLHVEPKAAVRLDVDQVIEDFANELRLPVRRKTHHLVLARVHLESRVIRERRVQKADRVRKMDLAQHLEAIPPPVRKRRRRPLPYAVH